MVRRFASELNKAVPEDACAIEIENMRRSHVRIAANEQYKVTCASHRTCSRKKRRAVGAAVHGALSVRRLRAKTNINRPRDE